MASNACGSGRAVSAAGDREERTAHAYYALPLDYSGLWLPLGPGVTCIS